MEQVYEGLRATVGGVHATMKDEIDAQRQEIEKIEKSNKAITSIKSALKINSNITV